MRDIEIIGLGAWTEHHVVILVAFQPQTPRPVLAASYDIDAGVGAALDRATREHAATGILNLNTGAHALDDWIGEPATGGLPRRGYRHGIEPQPDTVVRTAAAHAEHGIERRHRWIVELGAHAPIGRDRLARHSTARCAGAVGANAEIGMMHRTNNDGVPGRAGRHNANAIDSHIEPPTAARPGRVTVNRQ